MSNRAIDVTEIPPAIKIQSNFHCMTFSQSTLSSLLKEIQDSCTFVLSKDNQLHYNHGSGLKVVVYINGEHIHEIIYYTES